MNQKVEINENKILELTALYEISKTMSYSLNLEGTCRWIMEILSSILGMRRGTLTLLNPSTKELTIEVAHGLTDEEKARGKFQIGEGITGKVFEQQEPIVIPDIGKEPLFLNRTASRGDISKQNIAFLCVPVRVKGENIGVLSADRLFGERVSLEEDLRVLTIVASLIGQTVKLNHIIDDEKKELIEQNQSLQEALRAKYRFKNLVGQSKRMQDVYESIHRVSQSKATVLLRGESGTGKELIAHAIHYNSPRKDKPFIKLNCAAFPETLLESELFGHEKGSFTGAIGRREGRFFLAHEGTLFLDEISEIPPSMQVKLLRVLQERKFERVGGTETLHVDIRLIASTNRDLEQAVREGSFREDLYFRLNVVPIFIPPLRERRDDIPVLIEHFLKRFNLENQKSVRFSSKALDIFLGYHWPGNVRELENAIERAVVMSQTRIIHVDEVKSMLSLSLDPSESSSARGPQEATSLPQKVVSIERAQIIQALENCGWVHVRAAKLLGLTPRQIGYRIIKYRILTKTFERTYS